MRRVEWLNANKYRSYPLVEDALLDMSGGLTLGKDVLLDFKLTSFEREACDVTLTSVGVTATLLTFTFTYSGSPGGTFSITVPVNAATPYTAYLLSANAYRITAIFGSGIVELGALTPGTYTLTYSPMIEPALLHFQDRHRLTSVSADTGLPLTDVVYFEEGYNCSMQFLQASGTIRISAIRGAGAGLYCDDPPEGSIVCSDVLLRINGLAADDLGSFVLGAGNGVEITPDPDNHKIIVKTKSDISDERKCG